MIVVPVSYSGLISSVDMNNLCGEIMLSCFAFRCSFVSKWSYALELHQKRAHTKNNVILEGNLC